MEWEFSAKEEDAEDYIEHMHFEDITLPERDSPETRFDEEEKLSIEQTDEPELIEDVSLVEEEEEE